MEFELNNARRRDATIVNIYEHSGVFKYLGLILHKKVDVDEDVSHRIRAGWVK